MLNDKQKLLKDFSIIKERRKEKIESHDERNKLKIFFLGVFICLLIISITYLLSSDSNIYRISCNGNIYLHDEEIIKLSGLSLNDKYVFVNTKDAENNILKSPLIKECKIEKADDRLISINVVEKKIVGYCFEDNENLLILSDDSRIPLNKENLYLIEKVPFIEGFSKDKIVLIEKNIDELDVDMINEISEIHYYPQLKFQDHEVIMRDGNYIFTSVYGFKLINKYYDVVSSYRSDKKECYYIEDISGNVYLSACPWIPKEEVKNDKTDDNVETVVDNETDDEE